jgi:hypothetical protein
MAFDAGSVIARIKADLTEFQAGLKKAQDATKGMADKMKESWSGLNAGIEKHKAAIQGVGIAAAAVGAAGVLALRDWIQNANEAARTQTQLEAVLKSTKGAAGLTAQEINDLATKYQGLTTIGDDAIRSGQNILLTFTGIKKEAFEPATAALLDMSTAMNGGATPSAEQLKAQATQLGKALNDPTKGMAALARNGVVFTDQQAAMITKLQASGDLLGAQKIILAELATEYGGSASAQAATFEGKLAQLNNRWGDFKEQLGFAVIPVLEQLMEVGGRVMAWLEGLSPATVSFIAKLVLFGTAAALIIAPFAGFILLIPAFTAGLATIGTILAAVVSPIGLLIVFIGALAAAWSMNLFGIQEKTAIFFQMITDLVALFKLAWENDWYYMQTIVTTAFTFLVDFFTVTWETLKMIFSVALLLLQGNWQGAWDVMKNWAKAVFDIIGKWASAFWAALGAAFTAGGELIAGLWNGVMEGIKNVAKSAWESVKQFFVDAINWIINKMNSFINALNSVSGVLGRALGLGKRGLSIGTIPTLATGGIVTSPTLAMIGEGGEPEAVIPLSKMGDMGAGGGVHIHVDGAIIGSVDAAVDLLDMAIRRVRPNLGV